MYILQLLVLLLINEHQKQQIHLTVILRDNPEHTVSKTYHPHSLTTVIMHNQLKTVAACSRFWLLLDVVHCYYAPAPKVGALSDDAV